MYILYRTLTRLAAPFVPGLLRLRLAKGKEDPARLPERLGVASLVRPPGTLVWIHAASVGEANAVLPLIDALLAGHAQLHVLLTTVTVTSAALMAQRLPARALHQFAPVDTPAAVRAFLAHWQPDVALWVDSEFWPNLIMQTRKTGAAMGIVNARMSERSFRRWSMAVPFIQPLLACFSLCFAQSEEDAERLSALGLPEPPRIGNLKYEGAPLPCDEAELVRLRDVAGGRAVWLAASTHPGEESLVATAHRALAKEGMRPLTVIVPRHAKRGEAVAEGLAPLSVARRSRGETITPDTDIYLADTMGELGLFYRLAQIAFIGGSLVPHGGQNPLEPARLGCAILAGPHMENFPAIAAGMERDGALVRVKGADGLALELKRLLSSPDAARALGQKAQAHMRAHGGACAAITQELRRYLA